MIPRFRGHALTLAGCLFTIIPALAARAAAQPAASQPAAETTDETTATPTGEPAMPSLIEKLPNYAGDWLTREYLTGDWGGARTQLADQGVIFTLDLTQIIQGNAHGGKDTTNAFRYSGSVDYKLTLDTARMGLWPGGMMVLRGETQFGQAVNGKVGSLGSVNYDGLLPVPNDGGITTLSEYYVMQALSEKVVVAAGKMDLTVGDDNAFAHDEKTQFMNTALRINPVLFPSAPYTTMAAGIILLPTDWLTITTFVADNDPDGAVTKTGFNTAFHDRNWLSVMQEYTFKWKPFELAGHQRIGWFYTTRDFADFTGDPRFQLPSPIQRVDLNPARGGPFRLASSLRRIGRLRNSVLTSGGIGERPDDWGFYYNFDQYLYTEADDPTQGFGLFGRFGWSTGESNLVEEFYSIGLGGKGAIPSRDRDTWGLGYYMINVTDELPLVLGVDAEQGTELFYNIEVTPWLNLTPNLQVIVDPGAGFQDRDVAIVYGLRAQMSL